MKAQNRIKGKQIFFVNLPAEYITAVKVIKGMDFDFKIIDDSILITPKKSEI